VWWVSQRVRAEREHCCDDEAIAICGDAVKLRAGAHADGRVADGSRVDDGG